MSMDFRLKPEHIDKLTEMAQTVEDLKLFIAKMRRAGLPTEEYEARLDQVEKMRVGLLREFGPTSRT